MAKNTSSKSYINKALFCFIAGLVVGILSLFEASALLLIMNSFLSLGCVYFLVKALIAFVVESAKAKKDDKEVKDDQHYLASKKKPKTPEIHVEPVSDVIYDDNYSFGDDLIVEEEPAPVPKTIRASSDSSLFSYDCV